MSSTIALFIFAVIIGSIVYLFWRQNKMSNDLGKFYRENNLIFRETSPLEDPFIFKDVRLVCNDGMLKPETPYTLILGTRIVTDGQGTSAYRYIGVFLPPQVQVSDEWLANWQQKVVERGDAWAKYSGVEPAQKNWGLMGAPEHLPIRAARLNGGVFIGWSGLHSRKNIENRLSELRSTLS